MRQSLPRRAVAAAAFSLVLPLLAVAAPSAAHADNSFVDCGPGSTSVNSTQCTITSVDADHLRIDQPFVAGPSYEYKTIHFQPGDVITLNAGGCVQTGGIGDTWKRYVNPSGDDSGPNGGLYWGWATIPGAQFANGNPVQQVALQNLIGQPLSIPAPGGPVEGPPEPTQALDLILGYVDDGDDYDDNGYYSHDDGSPPQCQIQNDGGPAWLTISVQHGAAGPPAALHPKPFDVTYSGSYDSNYLYKNPMWGWQYNGGDRAVDGNYDHYCDPDVNCTSQFTSTDHIGWDLWEPIIKLCGGSPPVGHRNWFDVTYTGHIQWESFDGAGGDFLHHYYGDIAGDDDWNMNLFPPNGYGDTAGNEPAQSVHLEFDSDETVDNFHHDLWWNNLHAVVDNGENDFIDQMVKGHDAVAIGLMGIDQVHSHSEVHPVHALAIREAAPSAVDPAHDRWAMFARNWGNEGECGSQQHFLNTNQVTVDIPRPSGVPDNATATVVDDSAFWGHKTDSWPQVHNYPYGVQVTFTLPNGDAQGFENGELDLNWTGHAASAAASQALSVPGTTTASTTAPTTGPTTASNTAGAVMPAAESGDPEDVLQQIWAAMTPAQQQSALAYFARFAPPRPEVDETPVTPVLSATPPAFPAAPPTVSSAPDLVQMQILKAQFQSLCAATGGNLPTEADWCHEINLPPVTTLTTTGGTPVTNGWLITPVTATLTAADAGDAGIDHTEYSYDNQNWTTYTGPWTLPDGTYTLYYRSKDKAGNLEDTRSAPFKIDTKVPAITITQPTATNYPHSSTLTLNYSADDGPAAGIGAGSGVASVTATLDGASTLAGHGLASGQPINLLTELSNGAHTFTVTAADNAGHMATSSVTFTVIVTPESIEQDVREFTASGDIKPPGLPTALLAHLDVGEAAWNANLCLVSDAAYGAFATEVNALSGTLISPTAARIMAGDATYLIQHCGGG